MPSAFAHAAPALALIPGFSNRRMPTRLWVAGGGGVALLSPFDQTRYFSPFRPIEVSPLSPVAFVSRRGLRILASEAVWVWLPFAALGAGLVWLSRRRLRQSLKSGRV